MIVDDSATPVDDDALLEMASKLSPRVPLPTTIDLPLTGNPEEDRELLLRNLQGLQEEDDPTLNIELIHPKGTAKSPNHATTSGPAGLVPQLPNRVSVGLGPLPGGVHLQAAPQPGPMSLSMAQNQLKPLIVDQPKISHTTPTLEIDNSNNQSVIGSSNDPQLAFDRMFRVTPRESATSLLKRPKVPRTYSGIKQMQEGRLDSKELMNLQQERSSSREAQRKAKSLVDNVLVGMDFPSYPSENHPLPIPITTPNPSRTLQGTVVQNTQHLPPAPLQQIPSNGGSSNGSASGSRAPTPNESGQIKRLSNQILRDVTPNPKATSLDPLNHIPTLPPTAASMNELQSHIESRLVGLDAQPPGPQKLFPAKPETPGIGVNSSILQPGFNAPIGPPKRGANTSNAYEPPPHLKLGQLPGETPADDQGLPSGAKSPSLLNGTKNHPSTSSSAANTLGGALQTQTNRLGHAITTITVNGITHKVEIVEDANGIKYATSSGLTGPVPLTHLTGTTGNIAGQLQSYQQPQDGPAPPPNVHHGFAGLAPPGSASVGSRPNSVSANFAAAQTHARQKPGQPSLAGNGLVSGKSMNVPTALPGTGMGANGGGIHYQGVADELGQADSGNSYDDPVDQRRAARAARESYALQAQKNLSHRDIKLGDALKEQGFAVCSPDTLVGGDLLSQSQVSSLNVSPVKVPIGSRAAALGQSEGREPGQDPGDVSPSPQPQQKLSQNFIDSSTTNDLPLEFIPNHNITLDPTSGPPSQSVSPIKGNHNQLGSFMPPGQGDYSPPALLGLAGGDSQFMPDSPIMGLQAGNSQFSPEKIGMQQRALTVDKLPQNPAWLPSAKMRAYLERQGFPIPESLPTKGQAKQQAQQEIQKSQASRAFEPPQQPPSLSATQQVPPSLPQPGTGSLGNSVSESQTAFFPPQYQHQIQRVNEQHQNPLLSSPPKRDISPLNLLDLKNATRALVEGGRQNSLAAQGSILGGTSAPGGGLKLAGIGGLLKSNPSSGSNSLSNSWKGDNGNQKKGNKKGAKRQKSATGKKTSNQQSSQGITGSFFLPASGASQQTSANMGLQARQPSSASHSYL